MVDLSDFPQAVLSDVSTVVEMAGSTGWKQAEKKAVRSVEMMVGVTDSI